MQNLGQSDSAKLSGLLHKRHAAILIAFNIDTVMPTNQHVIYTIQAVYTALSKKLDILQQRIAELDAKLDECMSEADTEEGTEYTINSDEEEEESEGEEDARIIVIVDRNGMAFTSE